MSAEAGQLRMAMEEARAAAEEARRVRASLQAQLDDAGNSIQQLQATLARTATGAAGVSGSHTSIKPRWQLACPAVPAMYHAVCSSVACKASSITEQ